MTEPATPYDEIPLDVRRSNWGWFGEPWPGAVCYDDDGRLRTEMRKPTPVGEDCTLCCEPIEDGHSGQAVPHIGTAGPPEVRHAHAECMLRSVAGPPDHLDGRCTCRDPVRAARSYRDEAHELCPHLVPLRATMGHGQGGATTPPRPLRPPTNESDRMNQPTTDGRR